MAISYHGGKQRLGKKIADIIHEKSIDIENNYDFKIKGYCEPFSGMMGVYQHIPSLFSDRKMKYKAGDISKSVIMMWQSVKKGWKPPLSCTKNKYELLKYNNKSSAEKGFIGHALGFGGIYFGSYKDSYGTSADLRKYADKVKKISDELIDVTFSAGNYTQFSNLKGYVIYCDPPYINGSNKYFNDDNINPKFDHESFYKWCEKMSKDNIIFLSEYKAPTDFTLVWSDKIKSNGSYRGYKIDKKEKLFVLF